MKKISQDVALQNVLDKCIEKNYTLVEPFEYINSEKTKLYLKCNVDGRCWNTTYFRFMSNNSNCPKCFSLRYKPTQKESEQNVLNRCKEKDYILIEPLKYTNNKSLLHLKCNKDKYEWIVSYNNFMCDKHNTGCPKCGGRLKITQKEAEDNVLKKCEERNYKLIKSFEYINNKSLLHLKCNKDNYEWISTYSNFINTNRGCPKCAGVLKITQKESEQNVLNKCKERNYTLVEPFEYIGNEKTKLHLNCNKHNYDWNVSYANFINKNKGCLICQESNGERIIRNILTNKYNIKYENQKIFKNCKYIRNLKFDFYLSDYNICIEFDGIQHFQPIKRFGGEDNFKIVQNRDKIKSIYCKVNGIKLIRIRYDENIEERLKEIF